MMQVMLSLWSLFIEFLGLYSRCRVSNGVMPRVLGPTSFYLKFWVNILTIRMLLMFFRMNIRMLLCSSSECWCSSSECWCSSDIHLGSSYIHEHMSFWVYHMRFIWSSGQYPLKLTFPCTSECCWIKMDKVG